MLQCEVIQSIFNFLAYNLIRLVFYFLFEDVAEIYTFNVGLAYFYQVLLIFRFFSKPFKGPQKVETITIINNSTSECWRDKQISQFIEFDVFIKGTKFIIIAFKYTYDFKALHSLWLLKLRYGNSVRKILYKMLV